MELTAAKATKMYPACAIELYASSRFMFVCTSAPRLPANIVSAASTQKAQNQYCVAAGTVAKMRSSSANAAAFGPGKKRGHRSRSAFVNIRRPYLERRGGHFEAQPNQN